MNKEKIEVLRMIRRNLSQNLGNLMKRRLTIFAFAALAVVVIFGAASLLSFTRVANAGGTHYGWFAGSGFICAFPPFCPDVATAANGDTIEIVGEGTLSVNHKSVTGVGTYFHDISGDGFGSGTWIATELLSFRPYGPNADVASGLPKEFLSGEARIRVVLTKTAGDDTTLDGATAILTIGCLLGPPRSYPRGAFEGARLNVDGGPNFDTETERATLFIRLP